MRERDTARPLKKVWLRPDITRFCHPQYTKYPFSWASHLGKMSVFTNYSFITILVSPFCGCDSLNLYHRTASTFGSIQSREPCFLRPSPKHPTEARILQQVLPAPSPESPRALWMCPPSQQPVANPPCLTTGGTSWSQAGDCYGMLDWSPEG